MKKTIKIIAVLALLAIGFTSCHKDPNNEFITKRVKYEITCNKETDKKYFVVWVGREKPNGGYDPKDVKVYSEEVNLPWKYEYNTQMNLCGVEVSVKTDFDTTRIITCRLYVDDQLIEEQNDDGNGSIWLFNTIE